jgi:hypothetical protein
MPRPKPRPSKPSRKPKPGAKRKGRPAKGRPAKGRPGKGNPSKGRPARPAAKRTGRPAPQLKIRWSGFRPFYDYWGAEIKRFYQPETLASATEGMILANDRFILPSISRILGTPKVATLHFELFQEGKYQLIFRGKAASAKRKQATFGLVAAKHEGRFSEIAEIEHGNLRILNKRAPKLIVKPYLGGTVALPKRHTGGKVKRLVYVYITEWLGGYHELGIAKNLQFFINVQQPQQFTAAQTEQLKGKMIEVIAKSYDPVARECMEIPQIASGDFVVTKPRRGNPRLKLIACRRIQKRVTPARMIQNIAEANWDWGGRTFHLAPADPAVFFAGLKAAVGAATARDWLGQYRTAVTRGRLKENDTLTLGDLTELGVS